MRNEEGEFLKHDGVKLFYTDEGRGTPPLLFVHGWLMSHAVWRAQIDFFRATHRVVTVDLRGFGQSDKPDAQYNFELFVDDLDFTIHTLELHKPVLIGWSKGVSIALVYAAAHPETLGGLVLVDGGAKFIATDDFPDGLPANVFTSLLAQFETDFDTSARGFIDAMLPETTDEPLKQWLHNLTRQTTPAVALNSIVNDTKYDLRPLLPKIDVPTLILCGEQDTICPPGASRQMQASLPNAELHMFPGAGHAPFLTASEAFNTRLAAFLATLG